MNQLRNHPALHRQHRMCALRSIAPETARILLKLEARTPQAA
jgi:hypothetical protein